MSFFDLTRISLMIFANVCFFTTHSGKLSMQKCMQNHSCWEVKKKTCGAHTSICFSSWLNTAATLKKRTRIVSQPIEYGSVYYYSQYYSILSSKCSSVASVVCFTENERAHNSRSALAVVHIALDHSKKRSKGRVILIRLTLLLRYIHSYSVSQCEDYKSSIHAEWGLW